MSSQLFGTGAVGGATGYAGNIYYYRSLALYSGRLTHLEVYALANSNVRMAIYSDVASAPSARLSESASTAVTASAWNRIAMPNINIIKGLYYWIAGQPENNSAFTTFSHAGDCYQVQAYGAFPATASPGANAWGIDAGAFGMRGFNYLIARRDRFRTAGISLG